VAAGSQQDHRARVSYRQKSLKGETASAARAIFSCSGRLHISLARLIQNKLEPAGGVFISPSFLGFTHRVPRGQVEEASVNRVSVNQCAQCGADLIEPEWSEHFPDHRIRNVWSCEACGYEFEDTVYYSARELADAN
jgi:ribosomal protein L37AE/L43A